MFSPRHYTSRKGEHQALSAHVSILEIIRLCEKTLSEEKISAVANHIAECEFCHRRFVYGLRRRYPPPYSFILGGVVFPRRRSP